MNLSRFQPPSWSGSLAPDPNAPEGPLHMKYRIATSKMEQLSDERQFNAEWMALWSEVETIKNQCGGMPPQYHE